MRAKILILMKSTLERRAVCVAKVTTDEICDTMAGNIVVLTGSEHHPQQPNGYCMYRRQVYH